MKKRIGLTYYSRLNLGDDLFLFAIGEHFKNCKIKVIGNPIYYSKIKCLPKNIKLLKLTSMYYTIFGYLDNKINSNLFEKYARKVVDFIVHKKTDVSAYIVGSLFMEQKKESNIKIDISKEKNVNVDKQINLNSKLKHPYFIIGANIGPVYTKEYIYQVRNVIANTTATTFRDKFSFSLLSDMSNVYYAPDAIFSLFENQLFTEKVKKNNSIKHLVISIVDPYDKPEISMKGDDYLNLIVKIIEYFSNVNWEISLVSFCDKEGDLNAINIVREKLKSKNFENIIKVVRYNGNVFEILHLFKEADYVIASRFHSMIISLMLNKPFYPIIYGQKTKSYIKDIDFKGKFANYDNLSLITVSDVIYNYNNNIITDVTYHKENGKRQFLPLEVFLQQ